MTDYPEAFESLWSIWPKRDGRRTKKLPAYKKWKELDTSQKAALFACTEKHNRQHSWGRYIRDLVTFINQQGWDDVVDDPREAFNPKYHLAAEPEYECSKWEALANRWFLRWLRKAGGVPQDRLAAGIEIKNQCVVEMSAALDEDLARDNSRNAQTEAIWTFVNVLVDRLDQEFVRNLKPLLLKGAST